MQGQHNDKHIGANTVFFSLQANGSVHQQVIGGDSEFPRIFNSKVGIKNHYLFTLAANDNPIWTDTVNCLDLLSGNKTHFNYGKDFLVEEHIPISCRGNNEQGYLMGTALHVPSKRTCLNIFKADRLNDGPLCRAWLPYHMPLGFHGNFVAS
jgi:carotenoid cleavage dioxygenase